MAFVGWDFCPASLRIIYGRKIIVDSIWWLVYLYIFRR